MARQIKTQTGSKAIRAIFLDAQRRLEDDRPHDDPEPSLARYGGIKPGQWTGAPWNDMPPECPVRVLGMKNGVVYIVSATGVLHAVERWDHPTMMMLFAPCPNYPLWAWPAFGKAEGSDEHGEPIPPKVKRLERDKCVAALISEAGRRGIFDPSEQQRGRGGWKTPDGQFIWHSGDRLWAMPPAVNGKVGEIQSAKPAEYMGYFYAKDSAILSPWQSPVDWRDSPAHQLLADLKTWNWERPYLDPILYLGWLATGLMGGALEVRPIVFTTGGAGVGKSTLHGITRALFGSALYSTANTTAAGIYQNIKHDSRPVAVDEFEAKARGDKEQTIIELARQAYSGAKLYRGGQNHDGVEFELRSSFLFSAIMHPPLGVQDKSRMAILNLKKLDKGHGRYPVISDEAGRMVLRQIMDGWSHFQDVLLPRWKVILNKVGFDARAIDTYGTLLAAAELLVSVAGLVDAGMPSMAGTSGESLSIDEEAVIDIIRHATSAELAEQLEKWQDVIEKLLSATIDSYKSGTRKTVGKVLEQFETRQLQLDEAREELAHAGLGLRPSGDPSPGYVLAVPPSHPALDKIFGDGPYREGGWIVALKQAPEAVVPRKLSNGYVNRISKVAHRCLLVDIAAYEKHAGMED